MKIIKIVFLTILSGALVLTRECVKYRLSDDVKPSYYTIKIRPDLENDEFSGEVFLNLQVKRTVPYIELHSSNLNITKMFFNSGPVKALNGCPCSVKEGFTYDFHNFELIQIRRVSNSHDVGIPPGAHSLYIYYKGKITQNTSGFFKGKYEKNGSVKHYFVTDFQPTSARKAFPCFDEPRFKAVFQLNIYTPNDTYTAVSNMIPKTKIQTSDGILYKFQPTPLMSPYLLAFALTQCNYTEFKNEQGLPFRLYAPDVDFENNTRLLNFTSEVVNFYSLYTDFNLTLPKVDFIGFNRKASSATENWGLVTFNTSLLSSNNDVYDESQKMSVIAHELAHFWFGNLVTNDWWNDIWLQESIATFMCVKAEDEILNKFASFIFPDQYMESVLYEDQTIEAIPVVHYQEEPKRISQNFNDITYIKGASILRMAESVIGEEKLKEAIRKYVKKYAYKTATTPDLVAIIYEISNDLALRDCMETFLYQVGFPVVSVEEAGDSFVLKQRSVRKHPDSIYGAKWTIPVTYRTNMTNARTVWFHKDMDFLTIPKNNASWIVVNCNRIGYFRTYYAEKLYNRLISSLDELKNKEKRQLTLDTISAFELNITSCVPLLQLLWESAGQKSFHADTVSIVYIKLTDTVKSANDSNTFYQLKAFFGCIFQRAGKTHIANSFFKSPSPDIQISQDCEYNFDFPTNFDDRTASIADQIRLSLMRIQTPRNVTLVL